MKRSQNYQTKKVFKRTYTLQPQTPNNTIELGMQDVEQYNGNYLKDIIIPSWQNC